MKQAPLVIVHCTTRACAQQQGWCSMLYWTWQNLVLRFVHLRCPAQNSQPLFIKVCSSKSSSSRFRPDASWRLRPDFADLSCHYVSKHATHCESLQLKRSGVRSRITQAVPTIKIALHQTVIAKKPGSLVTLWFQLSSNFAHTIITHIITYKGANFFTLVVLQRLPGLCKPHRTQKPAEPPLPWDKKQTIQPQSNDTLQINCCKADVWLKSDCYHIVTP